nr:aldehyde dehydrogenase family protein [Streptomyces odonnellii]
MVVNPDESLWLHQTEVFGHVLSVDTYRTLDEAINIVNTKDKPLGLYIFGHDRRAVDTIVRRTSSGGVSVNELALHALSNSMGFGGVGPSGMGRYKGGEIGFEAFSNPQSVLYQSRLMARLGANAVPQWKNDRSRKAVLRMIGLRDPQH